MERFWGMQIENMLLKKRRDSHDISIVTVGLYWVKHIFGIYSAYIGTRRKPRGKQEENWWKAGGSKAVGQRLTKARKRWHMRLRNR